MRLHAWNLLIQDNLQQISADLLVLQGCCKQICIGQIQFLKTFSHIQVPPLWEVPACKIL